MNTFHISTSSSLISRFMITSNHGFVSYAQEELKRLFSSCRFQIIVPTEVLYFEVDLAKEEVLHHIQRCEPVFLRHIHPIDKSWARDSDNLSSFKLIAWLKEQTLFQAGDRITTQVRKSEKSTNALQTSEVKEQVEQTLLEMNRFELVTRDATWIISIYLTPACIYAGISHPKDNISDWSGGAIRFMREEHQISRAKFKLLEAEYVFHLHFSPSQEALDIGAAPGGWTSLLLERGLRVTAVDPAMLHDSLINNQSLTYLRNNAAEVKFVAKRFEWIVCDMSFSPKQSVPILFHLLDSLKDNGGVILTVKLMHKKPFQTMREVINYLEKKLQFIKAKQLFHNREEITIYFKKI